MPTYAYACADCGHTFDIVQSFADDSLTVCPECQGRLRKRFNAVGVVFKGSGFYRTDSRSGTPGKAAPAAASASGDSSGGDKAAPTTTPETASATTGSTTSSTASSTAGAAQSAPSTA